MTADDAHLVEEMLHAAGVALGVRDRPRQLLAALVTSPLAAGPTNAALQAQALRDQVLAALGADFLKPRAYQGRVRRVLIAAMEAYLARQDEPTFGTKPDGTFGVSS